MDWVKKNLTLVISAAVALVAIGGAGYYLFAQMGRNAEMSARLDAAVQRRDGFINQKVNPGFIKVDNIKLANEDLARLKSLQAGFKNSFKAPTPGGVNEQAIKNDIAETMAMIKREGERSGLTVPTNFNMSFTAQRLSYRFSTNGLDLLAMQLADLREISKILVDARVNSIESYKRVAVSDDDSKEGSVPDEYLKNFTVTTNEYTKATIMPYEVTFRGFSEELGSVLEGIAKSPYSFVVKTIGIEPATVRDTGPKIQSAASLYEGMPGMGGGMTMADISNPSRGGKDAGMASRYGGGGASRGARDAGMSSRYGGGTSSRPAPAGPAGLPMTTSAPLPTGPEVMLRPEPLKITLGFAVIHMPEKTETAKVN